MSVLYPNRPGSHFDVEYYLNVHMPMASRLLEPVITIDSIEIGRSGALFDEQPPFAAIVGFTCESYEQFANTFLPHSDELQGDVPNYTDIQPIIQVSDLRVSSKLS